MTDTTVTSRGECTREATDRKFMQVTLQIAVDRGISGVTIEEVARRSGMAKITIYRRYHSVDELLHEISTMYLTIPDPDPVPNPAHEHSMQPLRRLVDWVRDDDIGVKRVGIVLSSETELFQYIVDQVVTPWLEHIGAFLKQGVTQGTLHEGAGKKLLLSTIVGSLVAYEVIGGKAMNDDTAWALRMADLLRPALLR